MIHIDESANKYTAEILFNDVLATVGAWFVCIIAGGVYWSYVGKAGVDIFLLTVTGMVVIELLIDGILFARLKGKEMNWKKYLEDNNIEKASLTPDVPMIGVYDEQDRLVMTGWYFGYESRQPCVLDDHLREEDVHHCVMYADFADWNMHRDIKIKEVLPPHYIKVLKE